MATLIFLGGFSPDVLVSVHPFTPEGNQNKPDLELTVNAITLKQALISYIHLTCDFSSTGAYLYYIFRNLSTNIEHITASTFSSTIL